MINHVRVDESGQITVPSDVLHALGVNAGESIAFEQEGDKWVIRKGDPAEEFRQRLERARALARPISIGMNTDEYMAMIREPVPVPPDE